MSQKRHREYTSPPLLVDWDVFVVHPTHPRPKDAAYHDVLDALSWDEERSVTRVRQELRTPHSMPEISRALRLLVKDKLVTKNGARYVLA